MTTGEPKPGDNSIDVRTKLQTITEGNFWWSTDPPKQLSVDTSGMLPGSQCRLGTIEITSPTGEKSIVFIKVFDNSNSGRRWGDDAPRQQGLRKTFRELYPDELNPILPSVSSSDSDGHKIIIMENVPDPHVNVIDYHLGDSERRRRTEMIDDKYGYPCSVEIHDPELTREQKRDIFFRSAKSYLHFCRAGIKWAKENYDHDNQCYYCFSDQKGRDIFFLPETQRVIITDVQSLRRNNLSEIIEEYLGMFNLLFCIPGDEPWQKKMKQQIFSPDEISLLAKLVVFIRSRYNREDKLDETLAILEDYVGGRLKADDKRLELDNEGKI